jgi:thioredoxin-related protein
LKGEYESRIEFKEIDYYDNSDLARQYGAVGHPTLVLTQSNGESAWVRPGVSSREEIVEAIEGVLK